MLFVGKSEKIRTRSISGSALASALPTIPFQPANLAIKKIIDVKTLLSAGGSYGDKSRSN
jgi:hypothetical protein